MDSVLSPREWKKKIEMRFSLVVQHISLLRQRMHMLDGEIRPEREMLMARGIEPFVYIQSHMSCPLILFCRRRVQIAGTGDPILKVVAS